MENIKKLMKNLFINNWNNTVKILYMNNYANTCVTRLFELSVQYVITKLHLHITKKKYIKYTHLVFFHIKLSIKWGIILNIF